LIHFYKRFQINIEIRGVDEDRSVVLPCEQ